MKLKSLIPLIPAAAILAATFFSHSCANTTQAPSGGPKDTIPPVLLDVFPFPGTLNVPVHKTEISFKFNEYVKIKDQKKIYLSPPQEKPLKARVNGKSVIVSFDEDLLPATTYTIDITGAIVDNNEGNPFPGYVLTFSTGERIDSMYVTGIVQDCNTLNPVNGATVMLYKDQSDSALFLHRPDAAVKSDEWGFFCLRNIQDTCYRLYAIYDENGNNKYDPETEKVAFCDSVIWPQHKVAEGVYELYKFDMLDTAACLNRKNDYELNMFKGVPGKQMLVNKVRVDDRTSYLTFMAPNAQINKLSIKGVSPTRLITQFDNNRDSLLIWVNDPRPQPDTFHLNIEYMKTDSTGVLVKTKEKVKLVKPKDKKTPGKSSRRDIKHEDTIAVFKTVFKPETFEQYGIGIEFNYPLMEEAFDSLKYEVTNPRQKTEAGKYILERDTLDIRKVRVMHSGKVLPGYEYKLTVPHRKFKDINGYLNDSSVVKIKLPDDEKLSSITLDLKGVEGTRYIVDLMNEKRSEVLRSYTIDKDCTLAFPYLKEGKYCFRITEDKNRNYMVDTGDLLGHIQPESVRFFKLKDGSMLITLPASVELIQDIDISKLFIK